MKTMLFAMIAFSSISAFASNPVVTCKIDYKDLNGNGYQEMSFHDVGDFSVNNCIKKALKAKALSSTNVPFTFSHYTRTTLLENGSVNVDVNSAGWSLSAEITDSNVVPKNLKYEEFVNP